MKGIVGQRLIPVGSAAVERFDKSKAEEFARRSTSDATRRAYERVVREFFASVGNLHPHAIEHTHVRAWRDTLIRRRQKASTISFKLAVVRSFFSAPGIQYAVHPRFVIEGSYQLPVIRNTGAQVLRIERSLLVGVRFLY